MLVSVVLAVAGISVAWRFYVTKPDISARLAREWSGAHRTLTQKYYVDELYDASVVRGTLGAGRGLWLLRSIGDRRRGRRLGLGHAGDVVDLAPVRQVGGGRPRQPRRLGHGRIELRLPADSDGPHSELRALMLAGVFVFLSVLLVGMIRGPRTSCVVAGGRSSFVPRAA